MKKKLNNMNNEIQRKITSLTLMTIMVAGGMTFAIPGIMPDVSAESKETANLYVSTTTFGGPMVVEVIVRDPNLSETDEDEAEPDVTFDGNDLRMVQATDGYWYAYVAHTDNVKAVDNGNNATTLNNIGLDFGTECTDVQANRLIGEDFDVGTIVYVSGSNCETPNAVETLNVLRNAKEANSNRNGNLDFPGTTFGNNGLNNINVWPFIQTWNDFTDDATIDVIYHSGGSNQKITVIYDESMDDFADFSLDRESYPHGADVHLTISDNQLNIDPTDEDTWTFNTDGSNAAYYYLFDESGSITIDNTNQLKDYKTELNNAFYGDNGFLFIDLSPNSDDIEEEILMVEDNGYQDRRELSPYSTDLVTSPLVTVQETEPNSGIFSNTDNGDVSSLTTTSETDLRDLDFEIDYNDTTINRLVSFLAGSVTMDLSSIDADWGSGESLTVNILDPDENKNSLLDDDFSVASSAFESIPSISIGNPQTLEGTTQVMIQGTTDTTELQSDLNDANAALTLAQGFVNGNKTAADTVYAEVGAAALIANMTNQIADRDAAQMTLDRSGEPGEVGAAINAKRNAEERLAEINTALSLLVYNATQQKTLDALAVAQTAEMDAQQRVDVLNDRLNVLGGSGNVMIASTVGAFDNILSIDTSGITLTANPTVTISTNIDSSILDDLVNTNGVFQLINYDVRSLSATEIRLTGGDGSMTLSNSDQGLDLYTADSSTANFTGNLTIEIDTGLSGGGETFNILLDIFTFGQSNDGTRYNDAIYRFEAEETDVNTGVYSGTVEYIMLNQINIYEHDTYDGLATISDELDIIVHEDLTDEDGVEMIYLDRDGQGVKTQTSDKINAPTYSGVVSFDSDNYKVADTVTITLEDRDLNTDSDVKDIYTVTGDTIGSDRSLLLDVTFDDKPWERCSPIHNEGFGSAIGSLQETGVDTGVFTTNFQVPEEYCTPDDIAVTVTGLDIEVNYQDFRDSSGEEIEVGDSAGIRANTGSISLDRTVYPVPFGMPGNFTDDENDGSFFAVHDTAGEGEHLDNGQLMIHIRVNDPDYDVSGSGQDKIAESDIHGPVKVMVTRGGDTVLLGTAGSDSDAIQQYVEDELTRITIGEAIQKPDPENPNKKITKEFGPIVEIEPTAGIFEIDIPIAYTDGPESPTCPESNTKAVSHIEGSNSQHCILQGDILTVEYADPTDASGSPNTVTDSATFDLRNGVLQSDKSVYLIGSDMILTLIEPDFDLDNDGAETYSLDLIEWDSDAATMTMGSIGGGDDKHHLAFDPEPSALRETGDSTGIFQVVIEIPDAIANEDLDRGEEIGLEYTDWGPSGANYVGDEDEDINLTVYTSNFGATIELDQKVYTWTDKVYITIVAPDHNFDSDLVDEIGESENDPIKVSTRGFDLDNYKLVETGTDTGIFTGEVILTGFAHDADGDSTEDTNPRTTGSGPTGGFLESDDDDGLTVSFEFSDGETVIGSSLIRWNIGEVQWLEASYPASGTGVIRVIDPDMNLDPEAVDNFHVNVFSDSDAGGIDLTVTETNEATGIFEGTVFFTITDESSGHRLRVAEGDTVTAEYEDNTLPKPYTTGDELDITATSLIGTVVPPLERVLTTNLRTVDAFGNSLDSVSVDQQVQISADLASGQDKKQQFAYLVQVQDGNGVTVSLAWITGTLDPGQSFSPALSWIPANSGSYTTTAFVWESVDNPTALSPPVSTTVNVS